MNPARRFFLSILPGGIAAWCSGLLGVESDSQAASVEAPPKPDESYIVVNGVRHDVPAGKQVHWWFEDPLDAPHGHLRLSRDSLTSEDARLAWLVTFHSRTDLTDEELADLWLAFGSDRDAPSNWLIEDVEMLAHEREFEDRTGHCPRTFEDRIAIYQRFGDVQAIVNRKRREAEEAAGEHGEWISLFRRAKWGRRQPSYKELFDLWRHHPDAVDVAGSEAVIVVPPGELHDDWSMLVHLWGDRTNFDHCVGCTPETIALWKRMLARYSSASDEDLARLGREWPPAYSLSGPQLSQAGVRFSESRIFDPWGIIPRKE